ncbi:HdeD family acid-resistance protein [Bdellovibrio sp. HCB2-146]|uniref:HdeD family acid-resistance protein n=1 Tax=Bdellovibrio sp. HCB2-146 TaxID=3394362 RepID=UPI0039BCCC07
MSFVYLQKRIEENWGKILFVGFFYMAMGIAATTFAGVATFASVAFLGFVVVAAGIAEVVFAFQTRKEGRFWYHLFFGALAILCGVFVAVSPVPNALILTLAASIFLIGHGLVQTVQSAWIRYPYWGWSFTEGVIELVLGGAIIYSWPFSSFWTIGLFVGTGLLLYGAQLVSLAAMGRRAEKIRLAAAQAKKPPTTLRKPSSREDRGRDQDQDIQHFF